MRVIVIGGTGTIGSAVVKRLSTRHEVVVVGHKKGTFQVDLASPDSITSLFKAVGTCDAVVSTAGVAKFASLDDLTYDDYFIGLKNKLMGQANLIRIGKPFVTNHGSFTLTLWNYGTAVLTGEEAARFTELPWYQYVLFTLKYLTLPIGALVLAAFGTLLVLRPTHVLVWLIVPFLLVHSILPVKEVRFLFPLAPLIPWLLIAAKEAMRTLGVPLVPGSDGAVPDLQTAEQVAGKIGYPVLIKAAAGGGGRGQEQCHEARRESAC